MEVLESNPDVINSYLQKLDIPVKWKMVDVLGLDPELLALVPRPTLAVLFVFPWTEKYDRLRVVKQNESLLKGDPQEDTQLFFMKQMLPNGCGPIALIHIIANVLKTKDLPDSQLKGFIEQVSTMSPEERGNALLKKAAANAHGEVQQSSLDNQRADTSTHFVTFVNKNGTLYELDGVKPFPINHGPTSSETLLEDAVGVCKQFIEQDPGSKEFAVIAFTESSDTGN